MAGRIEQLELARLALQARLDGGRSRVERNRLGQFATPPVLAREMLAYAGRLLSGSDLIRFLDPAIGTGAFYSALRAAIAARRIAEALGFEADPGYGAPARSLWHGEPLALRLGDFTRAEPDARFNLTVCNPPYVRHHHLHRAEKRRLQERTRLASGMSLTGLAGLYCHFLGLAHPWLADGGVAGWLIPGEFMDVNYGQAVQRYLLDRVTLLHVHRFDPRDVQFADALVSSAVIWYRKVPRPKNWCVRFTFGGSLLLPAMQREVPADVLVAQHKWTLFAQPQCASLARRRSSGAPRHSAPTRAKAPMLSSFFRIKRGIATGDNAYFILPERRIAELNLPARMFTPILPSPRYLPEDEVKPRRDGTPRIERRLFLLDTGLDEAQIRLRYPRLAAYLAYGKTQGVPRRYLCAHRAPWYRQERRPAAPIVCTYLGRASGKHDRAFRFILNGSRATVGNVYLALYPTKLLAGALVRDPSLVRRIWTALRRLAPAQLLEQGRVYGGGLHKLEPRELGNVRVPEIAALLSAELGRGGALKRA
jgi:adenine-specific DNA-methyltransferase